MPAASSDLRMGHRLWRPRQWGYAFRAYAHLPVTFLRRVALGRDPYWRQYFWSRWGYFPAHVLARLRAAPVVWIDAISGGEVTQSVTFCRSLREMLPQYRFLLSTNNRYSYEFATTALEVDAVVDSPWDCVGPVRRALSTVSPVALIAIENLTSPVLFREAKRRGAIVLLVSGLMSRNFHLHPMLRRTMQWKPFGWLDRIGAKSEEDARGFVSMGAHPDTVVVTGNMKFDLNYLRVSPEEYRRVLAMLRLPEQIPVFLAASLHPGEEKLVGEAHLQAQQVVSNLRLIIVPRYGFHAPAMMETLRTLGLPCVRKSELESEDAGKDRAIVVDTFGELSRLYSIATVVFLGGSTYRRNVLGLGQNPVEPIAHRRPFFFGPFMRLWPEVTDELKAVWTDVEISTAKELAAGIIAVLENPHLRRRLSDKMEAILHRHRWDVVRNVELVSSALLLRGAQNS